MPIQSTVTLKEERRDFRRWLASALVKYVTLKSSTHRQNVVRRETCVQRLREKEIGE